MREFKIYYMGEDSVKTDIINADGYEIDRDTLVFYTQLNPRKYTHAYKEWLKVNEI